MKRSVKNFILVTLLGSAILVAGLSSDADGRNSEKNYYEFSARSQIEFFADDAGKHNSEFWNKFRESVMPDDKNNSSDYTGNDNPDPSSKKTSAKSK